MTVISRLRKPITLGPHFHYSEWTVSDYPFEERIIHGDVVFCGYEIVRCKITVSYDKDRHALHRTIQVARRVLREAVERDLEEYIAMRSSPWTYPEAREIPMPTTETRYLITTRPSISLQRNSRRVGCMGRLWHSRGRS